VVVAVGLTVTEDPLVAGKLPGVMSPAPLAKTPDKVTIAPGVIVPGLAVKLVMVGGKTVTVTD